MGNRGKGRGLGVPGGRAAVVEGVLGGKREGKKRGTRVVNQKKE